MSFSGPGLGQERVNRKQLLEQLEERKKILRMQAQNNQTSSGTSVPSNPVNSPNLSSPTAVVPTVPANNGNLPGSISTAMPMVMPSSNPSNSARETNPMLINPLSAPSSYDASPITPVQRTALQHAHANSVGYFLPQDSSFGNLILPVIPRFDVK